MVLANQPVIMLVDKQNKMVIVVDVTILSVSKHKKKEHKKLRNTWC